MRSRVGVVAVGLFIAGQLASSGTSWAWNLTAHRLITLDALTVFLGPEARQLYEIPAPIRSIGNGPLC